MAILFVLLLAVQTATYFLIATTAERNARQQVHDKIEEATETFERLIAQRMAELRLPARLLASDYAFASTFSQLRAYANPVTRGTLRSALQNFRGRIGGAPFLRLASLDGEVLADTLPPAESGELDFEKTLIALAEESPQLEAAAVVPLGNALHFVILRPLLMPEPSAWLAVGFPLDDALAADFSRLSHLEIAFLNNNRLVASTPTLAGGAWLAGGLRESGLGAVDIGGRPFLGRVTRFPGDAQGGAEIVMLRSLDQELAPFRRLEAWLLVVSAAALAASMVCAVFVARGVTRPVIELSAGVARIETGDYRTRVPAESKDELGRLGSAFNRMAEGLEERDKVRDLLGKTVSPAIARELLRSGLELGGELREATILFTDLRGFTAYSETQGPHELVTQLNAYFSAVSAAIESSGGVIDKFIGDAIMAVFGAPVAVDDHADRALAAALEVLKAEQAFNLRRTQEGFPPLSTGIGISTGQVVAGSIGSPSRCNYTVIGNEVNLASRLESLTKEAAFNARIICSDTTRLALKKPRPLRDLGETIIRGKEHPIRIWAVDERKEEGETENGKVNFSCPPSPS